jgi:hypothetical protein
MNMTEALLPHQMPVFLDFDGVMHPEGGSALLVERFSRAGVLEAWLQQCPDVRIVISSTWRVVHSEAEIRGLLGEAISQRLVGMAPLFKDIDPRDFSAAPASHKREAEIIAWLMRNKTD